MSKFDGMTMLKKTRARVGHVCSRCGGEILRGSDYYKEHVQDKFLQFLQAKKYCITCFEQHGDTLLKHGSGSRSDSQ